MEKTTYPILSLIDGPEDVRRLPARQLTKLADELRAYMIDTISKTGGHLASSLGAVELIIAMHRAFTSPVDKLIFDVGHQAYAHKILTGRRDGFPTIRQKDGISGFPKRAESEHDAFDTGHASTSISAALGMARARKLSGEPGAIVALIGDGALTGGMAYEALNDAGQADVPLIVILNDNDMSISHNVGAMRARLTSMRISRPYIRFKRSLVRALDTSRLGKFLSRHMEKLKNRIKSFLLPDLLFEELGFVYLGPIDGHDIPRLVSVFRRAKELNAPVIVHTVTQKGRGYEFSENDPEKFHGIAPFSVETGLVDAVVLKNNSQVFGDALTELARADKRIVAVTAAMPTGTGLSGFAKAYPERFFDVGIAEPHAVTMAAGMAACGMRPVVALYSSFLQRAYDQLLHDVCLQKLPVVIAVDRAGLVGEDGETHQGIYDSAFLTSIPNLTIYSPATQQELVHMLRVAILRAEPACIRYNRGSLMQAVSSVPVQPGVWEEMLPIADKTVIATGPMVALALFAAKKCGAGLINARTIRPLDTELLARVKARGGRVVVAEEGVCSLGDTIAAALSPLPVTALHLPTEAVFHATVEEQRAAFGVSAADIARALSEEP